MKSCCFNLAALLILASPASGVRASVAPQGLQLDVGGGQLEIIFEQTALLEIQTRLRNWVQRSARTVADYYGRFPVDRLRIRLQAVPGEKVRFGQAFGGDSPHIRVEVGEQVSELALQRDWIMVHEMVHLAMADLPRRHRWILEGLATYVESIARVRMGELEPDFVWRNFIQRMPQGLPREDDRGLDNTPTWGRIYWGGAVFFFLADIEIRRQSTNRRSLRSALRGILQAGYSMHNSATVMAIFTAGDEASGVPVLVGQYLAMRDAPLPEELDSVWEKLGISLRNEQVVYNDEAPLAMLRQAFFD